MLPFGSHVDGYYDVSDQMIHDLRRRADEAFRRREQERRSISSVAQFEAYRERYRAAFLEAIGGLPRERTPLLPEVTGTIDRGRYTIEKLIYQSLPEFYVTAALYVPKDLRGPAPAVLFVCGHAEDGKAYRNYQAVCVDLAENGFVVLAMDPPGQGERYQYFEPETGQRIIGGCTTEHTHAGLQYTLGGASLARQFVWDAIRAVDYLSSRPEVDANRIGLTGNSGGGTQSSFIMLAEPRIAAAMPNTFIMTLESYLKTGQAQDAEQVVRGAFINGPDHDDYITSMAPKPVLVGAVAYDFFPIEGTQEAVRRAKEIYRLYGAEDNVDMVVAKSTHEYHPDLRQACVNWMRRHLMGKPGDFVTGQPEILPGEALNATPTGQVLSSFPKSKTVFDLNLENARTRIPRPQPPTEPPVLRESLTALLGIGREDRNYPINARIIRDEVIEGYRTEHIFFFSAPDVVVTGVMIHPRGGMQPAETDLVLLEGGTSAIPAERERLEAQLRQGKRLFVFDPRGIGAVESRPIIPAPYASVHLSEYRLACDAMMLGISTLGLRVFDVLRGLDYLRTREDCQGAGHKLGLYGIGHGGLLAYLAAALDGKLDVVTTEDMLYSYWDLVRTRYYSSRRYGLAQAAWGLLEHFDLVDLLPLIAPARLRLVNPRNAYDEPVDAATLQRNFVGLARAAGLINDGWAPEVLAATPV